MANQTLHATITSKGQITLPAAIRRRLNLREHDRVVFTIDEQGKIELGPPRFPTVASLTGVAGTLAQPLSWQQMRQIAYEDRLGTPAEGDD